MFGRFARRSLGFFVVALAVAACLAPPARAGDVFVANLGSGEVSKFDTDTGQKSTFANGFNQPFGLALHPTSGDLYVSSFGDGTITKVSLSGQKTSFASGLPKPVGVAFSPAGDLFVACYADGGLNKGSVIKFSPSGQRSTLASRLTAPVEVAVDSAGDVLVSSYGGTGGASVYRITQAGAVSSFVPYTLSLPHGLASMGPDTYIAENGRGRILRKVGDSPPAPWVQSPLLSSVMGISPAGSSWFAVNANQGILVKISPQLGGPPVVSEAARGFSYPSAIAFRP